MSDNRLPSYNTGGWGASINNLLREHTTSLESLQSSVNNLQTATGLTRYVNSGCIDDTTVDISTDNFTNSDSFIGQTKGYNVSSGFSIRGEFYFAPSVNNNIGRVISKDTTATIMNIKDGIAVLFLDGNRKLAIKILTASNFYKSLNSDYIRIGVIQSSILYPLLDSAYLTQQAREEYALFPKILLTSDNSNIIDPVSGDESTSNSNATWKYTKSLKYTAIQDGINPCDDSLDNSSETRNRVTYSSKNLYEVTYDETQKQGKLTHFDYPILYLYSNDIIRIWCCIGGIIIYSIDKTAPVLYTSSDLASYSFDNDINSAIDTFKYLFPVEVYRVYAKQGVAAISTLLVGQGIPSMAYYTPVIGNSNWYNYDTFGIKANSSGQSDLTQKVTIIRPLILSGDEQRNILKLRFDDSYSFINGTEKYALLDKMNIAENLEWKDSSSNLLLNYDLTNKKTIFNNSNYDLNINSKDLINTITGNYTTTTTKNYTRTITGDLDETIHSQQIHIQSSVDTDNILNYSIYGTKAYIYITTNFDNNQATSLKLRSGKENYGTLSWHYLDRESSSVSVDSSGAILKYENPTIHTSVIANGFSTVLKTNNTAAYVSPHDLLIETVSSAPLYIYRYQVKRLGTIIYTAYYLSSSRSLSAENIYKNSLPKITRISNEELFSEGTDQTEVSYYVLGSGATAVLTKRTLSSYKFNFNNDISYSNSTVITYGRLKEIINFPSASIPFNNKNGTEAGSVTYSRSGTLVSIKFTYKDDGTDMGSSCLTFTLKEKLCNLPTNYRPIKDIITPVMFRCNYLPLVQSTKGILVNTDGDIIWLGAYGDIGKDPVADINNADDWIYDDSELMPPNANLDESLNSFVISYSVA